MATGALIDPGEALQWGLVNRVVPLQWLEKETMAMANTIASYSGAALELLKTGFYTMRDMDCLSAYAYLNEMLLLNSMTEDASEGIAAFLEKRRPIWKDC